MDGLDGESTPVGRLGRGRPGRAGIASALAAAVSGDTSVGAGADVSAIAEGSGVVGSGGTWTTEIAGVVGAA